MTTDARILGVDIGGTFTDFVLWDGQSLRVFKLPSTPDDPARAFLNGMAEAGFTPEQVVHGSTVATNALLERRGAVTAFVTTAGFADALEIGRQARPAIYALEPQRPEPLAPAERRFEVDERVVADGSVLKPLAASEIERVAAAVVASGAESAAVCLIFSFLYPQHERLLAAALRARGLAVSASVDVLPEYREYERMSTTVANAYVAPVMARYLQRITEQLRAIGVERLRVMQSDGGSISASAAASLAVRTVLSGPAGGVAGALAAGRATGCSDLITFDMGGTSTDVSLLPGRPLFRTDLSVAGLPVRTPAIDIHTVGAGGGSIAFMDAGGALRVGPQSAAAEPGPACYGRGDLPTVTDAQLVLGRLRPRSFLGGRMALDVEAAQRAIRSLGEGELDELAAAVIAVANANMERAIRVISVERGYDPRDFTLLAFGGAGPLHCCELADALGIPRVIVPPHPGVLSAFGMVVADSSRDYVEPLLRGLTTEADSAAVEAAFARMARRGVEEFLAEGELAPPQLERSLDMRYAGQSYEVSVDATGTHANAWSSVFHRAHEARYGHGHPDRAVEVVNARLRLRIAGSAINPVPTSPSDAIDSKPKQREFAPVWFGARRRTAIYHRDDLTTASRFGGPAIVVQMDSTIAVPPGWRATVAASGALVLSKRNGRRPRR
jgi:N-methylhydantoinase A